MTDGIDIGGQSRRFQAAVIVVTMLALLAGALAAASLSGGGSIIDIGPDGPGEDGGEPPDGPGEDRGEPVDGGGGGWDLPDVLVDILGWFVENGEPGEIGEGEIPPPPYNITVQPEPTPGAHVVVTVEKEGDPVPLVVVAFDGTPVGRTNVSGQLTAQVPYTDELTVTAAPPPGTEGGSLGTPRLSGGSLGAAAPSGRLGASAAGARRLGTSAASAQSDDSPANSSVTYELRTDVSARVEGVALPGETAIVRFTIAGNPLPRVDVTRDGEPVGITDPNGTLAIEVPDDATLTGSVPVSLARDEFAGGADIEVGDITASVETGLLALPRTGAAVEVRAVDSTSEVPLDGVPVAVAGSDEQVAGGETDENGTLSFTLPWADSVTATATTEHGSVTATASGLFLQLAGVVVALVLPVAGLAVWATRNPASRRRARERVVGALLTAGALLESAGRRFVALVRNVPVVGAVRWLRDGLVRTARWLWRRLVSVAGRLRAALAHVAGRLREGAWLALLLAGPRWFLGRLRAGLLWLLGLPWRLFGDEESEDGGETDEEPVTAGGRATRGTVLGPQSAYARLRRYWLWLVRRVVGRSAARTKTPVEIERKAIDRGLPADAVRRLRRAFQAVEYGPAEAEERVDDAESAHEDLREGEQ